VIPGGLDHATVVEHDELGAGSARQAEEAERPEGEQKRGPDAEGHAAR
jgi:hypothetical protein